MLTFHRTTNFGSALQTYGLYKKIRDLGYECEVIDYRCPAIEQAESLKVEWNIKKPKEIVKNILFQPTLNKKAKNIQKFSNTHMKISQIYTPDNIKEANERYDKIIVGSDIVWGRDITNDDYTYFLDFLNNKEKKYAFASSVGYCTIREDESKLKTLLKEFSQIAVREEEAVKWVKQVSDMDAEWVCDPTMLLSAEEWKCIIPPKKISNNYVLVYFDNEKHECLNNAILYAKKHNKKVYFIQYGLPVRGVICKQPTSLEEFLGLLINADAVFTASYHGILFSLYFHKKFMFYTRAHKSRVLSLARRLELEEYCGDKKGMVEKIDINYKNVDLKIKQFREESVSILADMLSEYEK